MGTVYESLAEKLSFPGSQRLLNILEYILSPEEAAVADALPGSPEEIAENTGMDVAKVTSILDGMFTKGLAYIRGDMSKRASFRFARGMMQLHDGTLATQLLDPVKDKKLFEMWQEFAYKEMYAHDADHAQHLPAALGRIIPAYQSIKDLPDVQPWENARELLKAQESIAVVPCACRWRTLGAGAPCQHTDEADQFKCLQFGKSADYAIMRGSGKALTLEEAIKNSDKAEEDGLVKAWMSNDQKMTTYSMCQCCDDCCGIFQANNINNVPIDKIYARSRFAAEVNQDDCSGCQNCVDRCKFDAIDMVKQGKKYKAVVNEDKCYGCGVCVLTCEPEALKMKTIRPVDHVPELVQVRLG